MTAPAPRTSGAPTSEPVAARRRRRNPWWIPPFLGRVPDIEDRYFRILGFVTLGLFFEGYDLSLLTAALPYIADDLGMARDSLGFYLGWVRVGGMVGFLLLPLADHFGRRLVFLASVVGMSVGTMATGFTQTPAQFIACQLATRAFIVTIAAVGVVMLAEEFPAEHRGWGIGMLGALGACGHGLGALLFAAIDYLPFGWRALYAIGAIPLFFLPTFRRELRETARFVQHQAHRAADSVGDLVQWLRSLGALARSNPRRAALVGSAGLFHALGGISVHSFASLFVKEERGWEPWQYSSMVLVAGGVGIIGNVVAGRLGDSLGRRVVGLTAFVVMPIAAVLFYNGPSIALPVGFAVIVFTGSAADVVVRALSTELFPTSQRAASAAWLTLMQTFGWIFGLWIVGLGTRLGAPLHGMVSAVALSLVVAGLILMLLPETRQRELEDLSHE